MKSKSDNLKKEDKEFSNWMRNFYNKKAKKISDKGYEYARWFSSKRKRRQYKFSIIGILYHLKNIEAKNCLEVGCGPGTWTKVLLRRYPNAKFKCVEISAEMLRQFKNQIKDKRVKTENQSFLDYKIEKEKYDLIFCSRALEYIPNKPEAIRKFREVLKEDGRGVIITSPPHPLILLVKKLFGKKIDKEHTQRISVRDLNYLLKKNKFVNIEFYPILFSDFFLVPTSFLWKKFYKKRWGLTAKMFASGYLVIFRKRYQDE